MKHLNHLFLICFYFFSVSTVFSTVTVYNWPQTALQSRLYSIKVSQNGVQYDPFSHFSQPNLKQGPDGDGVTGVLDDRTMTYAIFAFTDEVEVEVTKLYGSSAPSVELQPKSFGINPHYFDGKTVRFRMKKPKKGPAYISVNFETTDNTDSDGSGGFDIKNAVMIFGDTPEVNAPSLTSPGVVKYSNTANLTNADIIYFEPGDYNLKERFPTGVLPLTKNGQRVYLAGGAFVRGAVHSKGFDNVWLYGRGIITGVDMVFHEIRDENGKKDAFLRFIGSDNVRFEGFTVVNPTHHTMPSSLRTYIKNVKIIGWASNHDGIRPSAGSVAEEMFIKTSDDYDYARDPHVVRNSIFWPMRNGACGQLGWNNLGTGFTTYENMYYINAEWNSFNRNRGVIGSVLNEGVSLQKDTIQNIYAEDDLGILANITIEREGTVNPAKPGEIKDFVFKNIILESEFKLNNGILIKQPLRGFTFNNLKATIHDIAFINLVVGNVVVTAENASKYFDIDPNTTYNISFKTEGTFHTVKTSSNAGGKLIPSGDIPTPAGMDRYVQIVANPGFRIKDVLVDGQSKGRMQTVLFDEINANHTVEVVFEPGNDFFNNITTSLEKPVVNATSVFPNPFTSYFEIQHPDLVTFSEHWDVQVYSVTGQRVSGVTVSKQQNTMRLDFSGKHQKGMYYVRMRSKEGVEYIAKAVSL